MKTREEILKVLLETQLYLVNLRLGHPEDVDLRNAKIFLDALEDEFYKGWHIHETDKDYALFYYVGKTLAEGPYTEFAK